MAVFELDPMRYVPAGHHIIDEGEARLPWTFVTPPSPIVCRHKAFMVAEVMPAPPQIRLGKLEKWWWISWSKEATWLGLLSL